MQKEDSRKEYFEEFLLRTRYIVYIPVIMLILAAGVVTVWSILNFGLTLNIATLSEKDILIGVISMVDAFLLVILNLMIAVSLYVLYISPFEEHTKLPQALIIGSLDELKDKLGKLVYMILLVAFFKEVIQYSFTNIEELALLALSILLIAVSLYFIKDNRKHNEVAD